MASLSDILYNVKGQNIGEANLDIFRFTGACMQNIDQSRSQNFQDIFALYENDFATHGFFVEFGATDGFTGSNTYLLEKNFLWEGILAEPNPYWYPALDLNRNGADIYHGAVHTKSGEYLDFNATEHAELSTIVGYGKDDEHAAKRESGKIIKVETLSLVDLLMEYSAPHDIDYMSVDTEGSEYDILKAFFDNEHSRHYKIRCLSVEHNYQSGIRDKLNNLLSDNGYTRKFLDISRWDDFYTKDL